MPDITLRFGNFLAPGMMPVYSAIADHIASRLDCAAHIENAKSYLQVEEYDVCFICGLAYIELAQDVDRPFDAIAAPVLRGERFKEKPIYYSDVIVKRDSSIQTFEQLRGRSWCFNEPWSQSGYGITCYHLSRLGEDVSFFGQVLQSGYHHRSIDLVRTGAIDASAIDCHVLEMALQVNPSLRNEIRIIDTLGPSTIQPVTVSRRLPTWMKDEIQQGFLELSSQPELNRHLARGLIQRFVSVDDFSYDELRAMRDCWESICLNNDYAESEACSFDRE